MDSNGPNEEAIFKIAMEILSEEPRQEYLRQACGNDDALRTRVMKLIRAREDSPSFLESPPFAADNRDDSSLNSESQGSEIGVYTLREQIGEGGMGVVYVAEQTEPVQRRVALKIIKPGMDTKEVIARFEAERQALAFMEHPNIARVLDAGATESGRSYFVMELVRGIPITEYCDQVKATPPERLELFKTVCDAVQHAHQKGIIHRDIKPSNVLVTQVSAKPVVKVIDFGLAKSTSGQKLTDKTLYTGFMKLMGTPSYMSPEQAGLSGLDVDTRSDVYSLGVLLYELLTGTTPLDKTEIQKQAYEELCRNIREVDAPKPSARISTLKDAERSSIAQQRQVDPKSLRQLLDGDLDVVVLKALEKDRDRRYASPQDLANDIERFLNEKPVEAVPPSPFYIARKYMRRHKAAIFATATILALLLLATAFSTWQAIRATKYGKESQTAKQDAVAAKNVAENAKLVTEKMAEQRRRELYAANMQLADQLWSSPTGGQQRIEELLAAWIPIDDTKEDLREFSWRYQWTRLHQSATATVLDTNGATLTCDGNLITADARGITEWDAAGIAPTLRWGGDASKVTLSPDGRWAAIRYGQVTSLIDVASGESALEVPHDRCVFSADSKFIAAWTANVEVKSLAPDEVAIQVWSLAEDEPQQTSPLAIKRIEILPDNASRIQLDNDGRSFLLRGGWNPPNDFLRYWQVAAYLDERSEPVSWDHRGTVHSCAFSPNGRWIASGNTTGMIHVRHRSDLTDKLVISTHGGGVTALRFSPNGTKLAAGGGNGTIDIWDTAALHDLGELSEPSAHTPRLLRTIKAHLHAIRSLTFSSDGERLVSFASDGVSRLWDLRDEGGRYETKDLGVHLLDGGAGVTFEARDDDVVVKEVTFQSEAVSGEIQAGDKITGVAIDATGPMQAVGGMDYREVLRLVNSGPYDTVVRLRVENATGDQRQVQLRRKVKRSPKSMQVAFGPVGMTLAIADQTTGATSLNLVTGRSRRFPVFGQSVGFSQDGRMLALDHFFNVVLWDLQLQKEHVRLQSRVATDPISSNSVGGTLAFSPNGKFLAVGTGYRYAGVPRSDLKVWKLSDFDEVGDPLFKNDCIVSGVVFTPPDGSHLVAADTSGVIRIWETSTWKLERTINRGSRLYSMAISPDGRILATGGDQRSVLWDLEAGTKHRVLDSSNDSVLAFAPDGRTLASGNFDHSVVLWDVASGHQLRTFHEHTDSVYGASFSPDGNALATVGSDGVLRLYHAASFEEIDRHPGTLDAMFRLGRLRNDKERFSQAEAILRRLLQLQENHLPAGHEDIVRTRAELESAIRGKGESEGRPPPH